jgi:peptidoglycan/LPS O-acetylase OafA/YrhL
VASSQDGTLPNPGVKKATDRAAPSHSVTSRLQSVESLRGLGAVVVMLSHINHLTRSPASPLRTIAGLPFEFGYLGVPLFLVLSGFCIHLRRAPTMNARLNSGTNWRAFWRRRFVRLYPPYAVAAVLGVAAYYASSGQALAPWPSIVSLREDVLTHVLLVHNLFSDYVFGLGNGSLWTLALEEQLYLLYPAFLLCRTRTSGGRAVAWAGAIAVAYSLMVVGLASDRFGRGPFEFGNLLNWAPRFWFFWVLGALAAEAAAGTTRLSPWMSGRPAFVAASLIGFSTNPLTLGRLLASHWGARLHLVQLPGVTVLSDFAFAAACFVLLNQVVQQESAGAGGFWANQRLQRCGRMSYSLYLVHVPVINLLETICRFPPSAVFTVVRFVLYVPICLITASVFFHLIERRFIGPRLKPLPEPSDVRVASVKAA